MPFRADAWLPHAIETLAEQDRERYELFVFRVAEALPTEFSHLAAIAEHSYGMREGTLMELGYPLDGVVTKDSQGVAHIAGSPVAVWEIVRVFRRVSSVENLKAAYIGLSERELRTALAYAGKYPDEIGQQIELYEDSRRAREAYGFSTVTVDE